MDLAMLAPYLGVITNAQAVPATPIPIPTPVTLPPQNGSISLDSDITKTVLTVLAALIGALIGGVIAPLINRATSLQAAKQTLQGQRLLARSRGSLLQSRQADG
jgi:hypothetical protein